VASLKGSDIAESLFSSNKVQVSWSYGKYVENLDKQRMLLLMENEVKGRIPLEALPQPDYGVFSIYFNLIVFIFLFIHLEN